MRVLYCPSAADPGSLAALMEQLSDQGLTPILGRIRYIAELNGHPQPPYAKPLRNVDGSLCELRSPYGDDLLRIYYFVDQERQALILLNCIIKPDGRDHPSKYRGTAGKRLEKEINDSIALALLLKQAYPSNQSTYELLPH